MTSIIGDLGNAVGVSDANVELGLISLVIIVIIGFAIYAAIMRVNI